MKARVCGGLARGLIAGAVLCCAAQAARATIADCHDATCRITTPDGGAGSGCVFEISQGHVYVLTAAHVVGRHAAVQCEFWRQGHQSQPLPAAVLLRVEDDTCDAAVVALAESAFAGLLPAAIPVAAPDCALPAGTTVTSVGCANGSWSTGWQGHVLPTDGGDLRFVPAPANGRSGSAIFDAEGRQIVGVLRARTMDNAEGIACSLQALYAGLQRAASEQRAQCGPGGCPVPPSAPRYRVLPYRQKQEYERFRDQTPWPTLPPAPSPAPRIDPDDTNRRLDKIADMAMEILGQQRAPGAALETSSSGPSGLGMALAVLLAMAVGLVLFYATQNHTPL